MRGLCVVAAVVMLLATPGVARAGTPGDPIEPVNRGIFSFNDALDRHALEPLARGWDFVAPDIVQASVTNLFANLRSPMVVTNDLLQGKGRAALSDVTRFVINTTFGVGGLFDAATPLGLDAHNEDFGQTLGVWGVPPGPYLVLPLMGPSGVRDGFGLFVDGFTVVYPFFVPIEYSIAPYGIEIVNYRAQVLDEARQARQAAVDYYVFMRDAYRQRRQVLVADGAVMSAEEQDDLYYSDEEGGDDASNFEGKR